MGATTREDCTAKTFGKMSRMGGVAGWKGREWGDALPMHQNGKTRQERFLLATCTSVHGTQCPERSTLIFYGGVQGMQFGDEGISK